MDSRLGRALILIVSCTMLLSACAQQAGQTITPPHAPRVTTYITTDHAFQGPEKLTAGVTTLRLINQGADLHQVALLKLENGKTVEDLPKEYPGSMSLLPAWAKPMGGANAVLPGDQANATVVLEPGQYLLLCEIPDRQMKPHIAQGMRKAITVTESREARVNLPSAEVEVRLIDFGFSPSRPFTAGRHTIRGQNDGNQPHELVVVQLQPGASAKDFTAAFEPGAAGPPPGRPLGGLTPLAKGRAATFTAEFVPGTYALLCFQIDPETGKPHFAQGMMTEFTVQ